jgi:hypothetical protein
MIRTCTEGRDALSLSFVGAPGSRLWERLRLFVAVAVFAAGSTFGCSKSGAVNNPTGPYLTELTISPTLTLVPPFSPGIHDYYVVCAAGTNSLTVSMTAVPGAESMLLQPTKSRSLPQQSLSLDVKENQAIVAVASQGTATTEYWVRCLPHDFTPIQMSPHPQAGSVTPGYYLIGDIFAPPTGPGFAMVVDPNGVPVWYYQQPRTGLFNSTSGVFDVDMVVPGAISFIGWPSAVSSSPFEVHQLSPLQTTYVPAAGLALDSHELRLLSNGDFLLFTDETETGIDLTGYPGLNNAREPFGPNGSLLPCDVLEVDPKGKLVWKWVGTDHFDPVKDSTYPATSGDSRGATVADPFHCNSIEVDPENGNLLISSRDMDSIFYIERSSGKVLWKMGGATYTKDNAIYIPVADPFYRQHDARLQPGWSSTKCGGTGQISIFDDETAMSNPARAVVYDVTAGSGNGCAKAGASVAWQFAGATSSGFMGSFRILDDGSRVIGWGYEGETDRIFTEVDVNGNDLLDFYFLDGSSSFRGIKVPLTALDLGAMRRAAGHPPAAMSDAGSDDGSSVADGGTGDGSDAGLQPEGASDASDEENTEKDATTADAGPDR